MKTALVLCPRAGAPCPKALRRRRTDPSQRPRSPVRVDQYTEGLAETGIESSVGSVGDSYGNAFAEAVIGLFKTEVIRRRGRWRSLEAVVFATLERVDWFNHRRLLEPIGDVPPAEAEPRYQEELVGTAEAAWGLR